MQQTLSAKERYWKHHIHLSVLAVRNRKNVKERVAGELGDICVRGGGSRGRVTLAYTICHIWKAAIIDVLFKP